MAPSGAWWDAYLNSAALLAHVSIMFTVMAIATFANLIFDPETRWSLAILVIWLVLIAVHALGILANRLLTGDDAEEAMVKSWQLDPEDVAARSSSWGHSMSPADPVDPATTSAPSAANDAWGTVGQVEQSWPQQKDDPESEQEDRVEATGVSANIPKRDERGRQRIPWRAATDIAWLRHREDGATETEKHQSELSS